MEFLNTEVLVLLVIVVLKFRKVSIKIGDARKAEGMSNRLLNEFGVYIQHINYPTVAKGDERLRIIVTPFHSKKLIDDLVRGLQKVIENS